jgi:hypothetical protein
MKIDISFEVELPSNPNEWLVGHHFDSAIRNAIYKAIEEDIIVKSKGDIKLEAKA